MTMHCPSPHSTKASRPCLGSWRQTRESHYHLNVQRGWGGSTHSNARACSADPGGHTCPPPPKRQRLLAILAVLTPAETGEPLRPTLCPRRRSHSGHEMLTDSKHEGPGRAGQPHPLSPHPAPGRAGRSSRPGSSGLRQWCWPRRGTLYHFPACRAGQELRAQWVQ